MTHDKGDLRKLWSSNIVETLTTNPYFSVLLQDVTVPDGSKRTYYTIHFTGPAVGVVATRGSDVLLIRQYRFIVDEFVWAIPSGGVIQGETAEAAAKRELHEETGYSVSSVEPLLRCYASYGCSDQSFEIFLAKDPVLGPGVIDANEVINTRWFSRQELLELVLTNGIVDNLSLSPLLIVLLQGSI